MLRLLQIPVKAGIVRVIRGSGGTDIEKPLTKITLLDVYNAECEAGSFFISMKTLTNLVQWEKIFILF